MYTKEVYCPSGTMLFVGMVLTFDVKRGGPTQQTRLPSLAFCFGWRLDPTNVPAQLLWFFCLRVWLINGQ